MFHLQERSLRRNIKNIKTINALTTFASLYFLFDSFTLTFVNMASHSLVTSASTLSSDSAKEMKGEMWVREVGLALRHTVSSRVFWSPWGRRLHDSLFWGKAKATDKGTKTNHEIKMSPIHSFHPDRQTDRNDLLICFVGDVLPLPPPDTNLRHLCKQNYRRPAVWYKGATIEKEQTTRPV